MFFPSQGGKHLLVWSGGACPHWPVGKQVIYTDSEQGGQGLWGPGPAVCSQQGIGKFFQGDQWAACDDLGSAYNPLQCPPALHWTSCTNLWCNKWLLYAFHDWPVEGHQQPLFEVFVLRILSRCAGPVLVFVFVDHESPSEMCTVQQLRNLNEGTLSWHSGWVVQGL